MKKHILFSFIFVLQLLSIPLIAQQEVRGTVSDEAGEPLIGVTVREDGTNNGTVTNFNGNYQLSVSGPDAILVFSYIGLQDLRRPVESESIVNVTMSENAELLDEVVVTALGFEAKEDEIGYASSKVDGSDVTKAAESTIINSLSGKASGVRISRNSGDPGAGAYIQIRGISTIDRNAQPLIVVDGIPISNDSRGAQESLAAQSRLNDINPNDIESVTVLKGASAAALWGTRALGGVIVIKTKSGKFNKKLSVTYKTSYSLDQINRRYPQQTTFGQGDNGVYNQRARDSWGDKISERAGGPDEVDTNGEFYIDQDGNAYYPIITKNDQSLYNDSNFDQVYQDGHFWENNLSVTGGNENSTIYASLSDLNQQGIIRNNSDYRRTTARINVGHLLSEKVKINASATYTKSISNRIRRGASSSGLQLGLLRTPVDFDNTGYRGDYYANPDASPIANRHRSYREPLGADATATYNNPSWTLNEQESLVDVDRFITSMELTVSPLPWLDLIGRVGLDKYAEVQQLFFTPGSAAGEFRSGLFDKELARSTILNMDYIARAGKTFSRNFSATALLGFNYNHRELITDGSRITNFILFTDVDSGIRDIDNALPENRTVNSTFGEERTVGVYGSTNLTFYNMFFLNATLRAESASTFGDEADNTFYFPSASLAWQFTELPGMKSDFLSFGKLRFSYGEVGVQPARYNTSNIFVSPVFGDQYGGDLAGGLYGNGAFVASTQRGSANLRPERKKETEIGIDLRFLKDKLSISATYYQNTTEDVLLDFPIANSRGVTRLYTNGAELQNQGVELDLGYTVVRNKDWFWKVDLIYSKVENEVTRLDQGLTINLGGLSAVNARALQGFPIGVLWGSRTLRDDGGNIVFDENGFPVQDQVEGVIGDPNPDWTGSAVSTLSFKNWSLSVLFETYQGADIFAGTKSVMYDLGTWGGSDLESMADQNLLDYNGNVILAGTTFRGQVYNFGAGPVALTEPWYNGDGGFFSGGNDELYIEDGSWTRLREISLSYTAKSDWLKRNLGITNAQFTLTGRNLVLWTPFEGNDPDTNLQGVSVARGIDYFNNPGTKSYIGTLTVTF
ncbi:MAG: SusC/RagA family TonB-linked outer membrane protein [Saprospiraceae bacterium]|nr:SusC/RagA family TonB-linked outer membrane protein [Saprospiraceae bacterium]